MKLSFAAGMLAQTTKTTTATARLPISSSLTSSHQQEGVVVDIRPSTASQNQDSSTKKESSSSSGRSEGLLTNYSPLESSPDSVGQKKYFYCDPSISSPNKETVGDPDIGILSSSSSSSSLSCPMGYDCRQDDTSPLGGICHLESRECDPSLPHVDHLDNDCLHDEECIINATSSLGGRCISTTTATTTSSSTTTTTMSRIAAQRSRRQQEEDEFVCLICERGDYIPEDNYEIMLYASFGYDNMTCADVIYAAYFDFTTFVTIDEGTCPYVTEAARVSGCCGPELDNTKFCDFCGSGLYISPGNFDVVLDIPLDGYEGTTCGYLVESANYTVFAYCSTIAQVAKAGGCCAVSIPSPDACRMCIQGTSLLEEKVVDIQGSTGNTTVTCGEVQTDESLCQEFSPTLADVCCQVLEFPSPSPTAPPQESSNVPTSVPREGGGGGGGSDASTPSAASTLWSSSTTRFLVSIVCLAATMSTTRALLVA